MPHPGQYLSVSKRKMQGMPMFVNITNIAYNNPTANTVPDFIKIERNRFFCSISIITLYKSKTARLTCRLYD